MAGQLLIGCSSIVRKKRIIASILRIGRRRYDDLLLRYSHPIVCMKQHLLLVLVQRIVYFHSTAMPMNSLYMPLGALNRLWN